MSARGRVYVPDEVLLRRFGLARAVGGAGYLLTAMVFTIIYGWRAWPLLLGVPVLAVVTTVYFQRSSHYPRLAVAASLTADALVLGGAAAFVGGSGSGVQAAYAVVVVSAGLLLGPTSAAAFTVFCIALSWLQLLSEQLGIVPLFLHREPLDERVQVLLITSAILLAVGYQAATYASRLHEALFESGDAAEAVRSRSRRRRQFISRARVDTHAVVRAVEGVAEALEGGEDVLTPEQRRALASDLRAQATRLSAEVAQLADVGALDEQREQRPEPVDLAKLVDEVLVEVGDRLDGYRVTVAVPVLKVVGDRRAARRILFNLLDNVADHTPAGTNVRVEGRITAGHGVLVVTDDGPGVSPERARRLFEPPPDEPADATPVGLPLVKELAESMDAEVGYQPARGGGSRFMVSFRLAPRDAPTPQQPAPAATPAT